MNPPIAEILSAVSEFLMTPPIAYFVGIVILFYIAGLVHFIIHGRR